MFYNKGIVDTFRWKGEMKKQGRRKGEVEGGKERPMR